MVLFFILHAHLLHSHPTGLRGEEGTPQQLLGKRRSPPASQLNITHSNFFKSFLPFLLF